MNPLLSARNFMPSSTAPPSFELGPGGVVSVQMLHGHVDPVPVVKAHVKSAASAFPATSFTPLAPPLTFAV